MQEKKQKQKTTCFQANIKQPRKLAVGEKAFSEKQNSPIGAPLLREQEDNFRRRKKTPEENSEIHSIVREKALKYLDKFEQILKV